MTTVAVRSKAVVLLSLIYCFFAARYCVAAIWCFSLDFVCVVPFVVLRLSNQCDKTVA